MVIDPVYNYPASLLLPENRLAILECDKTAQGYPYFSLSWNQTCKTRRENSLHGIHCQHPRSLSDPGL